MVLVDDHKTWRSTTTPVPPRLELRHDRSVRTILDGAWWPRSRAAVTELTNLVREMDGRRTPINWIMLNPDGWDDHPRRIRVDECTVRVGWFVSLDAHLLVAVTGIDDRVDLLTLAADMPAAAAAAAITMSTEGAATLRPGAIMDAVATRQPDPPQPQSGAEFAWESEGGRVDSRQP